MTNLHSTVTAQLIAAEQAETEARLQSPGLYSTVLALDPSQPTPYRVRFEVMQRHAQTFRPGAPRVAILRSLVAALPGRDAPDPELTERLRRLIETDIVASVYLENLTKDNLRTDPEINGDPSTPGWWVRATPLEGAPLTMDDLRRLWNMGLQIEGARLMSALRQLMNVNLTPREALHVEAGLSRVVLRQLAWQGKGGDNEFFFMLALRPEGRSDVNGALEHYSHQLNAPDDERTYPEDNHLLPYMVGWVNGVTLAESHTVLPDTRREAEVSLKLYDANIRALTALDHRGDTYEQLTALLNGTSRYAHGRNGRYVKDDEAEQFRDHVLGKSDAPDPSSMN